MSYSVPPFDSLWPMRHQAQNENAKKQGRHPCTQSISRQLSLSSIEGCVCEQITNLVQLFLSNFSQVGALLKRGNMKRDPLQSPIE
jgi:hypothetical protein